MSGMCFCSLHGSLKDDIYISLVMTFSIKMECPNGGVLAIIIRVLGLVSGYEMVSSPSMFYMLMVFYFSPYSFS